MPLLMGHGEILLGGVVLKGELSSVSEANREGVEGEPQATLGGLIGSPRIGQWCRFCGSLANPSSDQCVPCWSAALAVVMEVSIPIVAEGVVQVLTELIETTTAAVSSFDSMPSLSQLLDPATP